MDSYILHTFSYGALPMDHITKWGSTGSIHYPNEANMCYTLINGGLPAAHIAQ